MNPLRAWLDAAGTTQLAVLLLIVGVIGPIVWIVVIETRYERERALKLAALRARRDALGLGDGHVRRVA